MGHGKLVSYYIMFDLLYDDMNIGDTNTAKKELHSLPLNLHNTVS